MKHTILLSTILLLALASILFIEFPTSPTGHAINPEEQYKIGVILPMSGHFTHYGETSYYGIELANKELSNIKIILEDDKGEPKEATKAALKLITQDKVDAIITFRSSISSAVSEISQEHKVPTIYSSVINAPATNKEYVFKNFMNIEDDCNKLGEYLKDKSLFLIGLNLDSTRLCLENLKLSNPNINYELFEATDQDYKSTILKVSKQNPEYIVLRFDKKSLPLLLKQFKELNYNPNFVCPSVETGGCIEKEALEFSKLLKGTVGTGAYTSQTSALTKIQQEVKQKYNADPILFTYSMYENVHILNQALTACNKDKECTIKFLRENSFQGLEGEIKFNSEGIAEKPSTIVQFNGENWEPIS